MLQNPLEVLTAEPARPPRRGRGPRTPQSRSSPGMRPVIRRGPAPLGTGTLTWRFHADSVRDFAFAAAPNFQLGRQRVEGHPGPHLLPPLGATLWPEANRIVREALRYYSQQWYHYPYAHISSIEGPIEGMEYPMMTFDPAGPTRIDLQWVLAHELGHQWMPMVVGSNERLYPWMDEGLQHLHRPGQRRQLFRGHAVRRLDRGAPAAPLPGSRDPRPGTAAHHPPGGSPATSSGPDTRSRRS